MFGKGEWGLGPILKTLNQDQTWSSTNLVEKERTIQLCAVILLYKRAKD